MSTKPPSEDCNPRNCTNESQSKLQTTIANTRNFVARHMRAGERCEQDSLLQTQPLKTPSNLAHIDSSCTADAPMLQPGQNICNTEWQNTVVSREIRASASRCSTERSKIASPLSGMHISPTTPSAFSRFGHRINKNNQRVISLRDNNRRMFHAHRPGRPIFSAVLRPNFTSALNGCL